MSDPRPVMFGALLLAVNLAVILVLLAQAVSTVGLSSFLWLLGTVLACQAIPSTTRMMISSRRRKSCKRGADGDNGRVAQEGLGLSEGR